MQTKNILGEHNTLLTLLIHTLYRKCLQDKIIDKKEDVFFCIVSTKQLQRKRVIFFGKAGFNEHRVENLKFLVTLKNYFFFIER